MAWAKVLLGHGTQLSYSSGNNFVKRNVFNCLLKEKRKVAVVSEWERVSQFIHSALKAKRVTSALKRCLNCPSSTSGCRSVAGRLLHTFGPATEKLLSPSRVLVRGTVRALASAERRQRRPESAISWQSSARYDGVSPRNDWKTIMASL